jgi:hypothetical protein
VQGYSVHSVVEVAAAAAMDVLLQRLSVRAIAAAARPGFRCLFRRDAADLDLDGR